MTTVTRNLTAALIDAADKHCRVRIALGYDACDPYAVTLTFAALPDTPWRFARDLLAGGRHLEVGHGDVGVWPNGDRVHVRLSSPDGSCVLTLPARVVKRFIDATAAVVAFGDEHVDVDVDGWIAAMLTGGAA